MLILKQDIKFSVFIHVSNLTLFLLLLQISHNRGEFCIATPPIISWYIHHLWNCKVHVAFDLVALDLAALAANYDAQPDPGDLVTNGSKRSDFGQFPKLHKCRRREAHKWTAAIVIRNILLQLQKVFSSGPDGCG